MSNMVLNTTIERDHDGRYYELELVVEAEFDPGVPAVPCSDPDHPSYSDPGSAGGFEIQKLTILSCVDHSDLVVPNVDIDALRSLLRSMQNDDETVRTEACIIAAQSIPHLLKALEEAQSVVWLKKDDLLPDTIKLDNIEVQALYEEAFEVAADYHGPEIEDPVEREYPDFDRDIND